MTLSPNPPGHLLLHLTTLPISLPEDYQLVNLNHHTCGHMAYLDAYKRT